MNYEEIEIQGFRSFDSSQIFNFGSEPGLYHLTGENKSEPSLEANGSGKSSITDALIWALYGKTSTGQRGQVLQNWSKHNKACVTLWFSDGTHAYILQRTLSPNKIVLTIDGESSAIDQDSLNMHLKESFDSFLRTHVLTQFGEMFLDLKPAAKLQVFSDALQLEKWSRYSAEARAESTRLTTSSQQTSNQLEQETGAIHALSEIDYAAELQQWDEQEALELSKITADIASLEDEIILLEADKEAYTAELLHLLAPVHPDSTIVDNAIAVKSKRESAVAVVQEAINRLQRQLRTTKKVETHCPTCKRKYDTAEDAVEQQEKEKTRITEDIQKLHNKLDRKQKRAAVACAELASARSSIADSQDAYLRYTEDKSRLTRVVRDSETRIETAASAIKQKKSARLHRPCNPYTEKQKNLKQQISEHQQVVKDLKATVVAEQKHIASYSYWVKGFKNVQLFIIEEALTHLEMEVNSALNNLGLVYWKITFVVESETTSNTVSKGFKAVIHCPHKKEAVPWESWSGGEKQRLKLAVTLGMANLLLDRKGIASNVEFYDEPTQGLSAQGILDTLDTLRSRAHALKKRIWIVDHHSQEYGGFTGVTRVIKDDQGSTLS